jgi:hypothetical protein
MPERAWEEQRSIDDDFLDQVEPSEGTETPLEARLTKLGPLSAFADVPFLMLLGRPGSGKSQEMHDAEAQGWLGQCTILVEAKEIGTANPGPYVESLLAIQSSEPTERIIIDGLDEALLQNPNFVTQLKAWLRRSVTQEGRPKFHLAISCRWADWPVSQVEELASLWSANESLRLVLGPLQQTDVVASLQRRFGDRTDDFWRELNLRHLRNVACWPQGLLGLMGQFEDSGCTKLAPYAEVIRDQILRQCRLADSRDDLIRWSASAEDSEWRRRIAGRVAAAMIFSGKALLDLNSTIQGTDDESISLSDLNGTDESKGGQRLAVKLADLDDIVHLTGLMKLMADKRRWAFQSQVHQEWLAADWLAAQQLDENRLQQLFGTRVNGQWTIFPVLRTVAAWLASFDKSFLKLVLQNDPLVLLRMDGASLPEKDRKEIIEALLKKTNSIRVVDSSILQAHLPSLKHSTLSAQLTAWLRGPDVCDPAKELAIEISEKTQLKEIVGTLWELFPKCVGRLQNEMAGALYRLAREGFDEQWRAVLRGEMPIDSDGTLLGAAIEIMVTSSHKIPVREILHWIIPEHHTDVYGVFEIEARTVHQHLTVTDLPTAFAKLAENARMIHDSLSRAKDLHKSAMRLAIKEFDRQDVASALADYWHECIRQHAHPHHDYNASWKPEELGLDDDEKRRRIILKLVTHRGFETNTTRKWLWAGEYLILPGDLEWCLDMLIAAEPEAEWRFALIASSIRRPNLPEACAKKLVTAWQKSPILRQMLPPVKDGETIVMAIDRVAAEHQAERDHEASQSARRATRRESKFEQNLKKFTQGCKEAHDHGKLVWPSVEQVLGARLNGQGPGMTTFDLVSKIGQDDEWMVEAAKRYLTDCPLVTTLQDGHGTFGLLALAACLPELEWNGTVAQSIAKHWLHLFIGHLSNHYLGEVPAGISNEHLAKVFPADFVKAFGKIICQRYTNKSSLYELSAFEPYWSEDMTTELACVLDEQAIQAEGFFNGLKCLASVCEDKAVEIALKKLLETSPDSPIEDRAALIGATATILNGRLASEIQEYLGEDEFVRQAIRAVANRLDLHDVKIEFAAWPDGALKELADACWRAFPQLERRRSRGVGFQAVTDEHKAIEFRDHITSAAHSRGLEVAIPENHNEDNEDEARQRIRRIDWHRHAASQARAGNSWQLLTCSAFFALASRPHARLARNTDELLSAVIECLERWESSLASGSWDHLWDLKTRSSRPEERIAREMRDWLRHGLDVIVEREIELSSEDRTDITVQTLPAYATSPQLTVVIELKKLRKSNAKERRTAMKTQLLDRYLNERRSEGWTHGLYVVAWTPEPGSKEDNLEAIESARDLLAHQANELSVKPFVLRSMVVDARFRGADSDLSGVGRLKTLSPPSKGR